MRQLTITLGLVLAITAGAAADASRIQDGDRIRATLVEADGSRELDLPAAAGTDLRIRVRGEASLVLLDPDGRPLEVSEARRPGRALLHARSLPLTGVYRVLLSGDGPVRLKVRSRSPRKLKSVGVIAAGGSVRLPFAATRGSRIDVELKGSNGFRPDVPSAEVPGDGEVPLRPRLTGRKVSVEGIRVPDLGDGTVLVTSRTEDGGRYRATIRLHPIRTRRRFTLPALSVDERRPGGDLLVLGASRGRLDDATFALRVRATRVHLLRGRGPSGEDRERLDVVLELESKSGGLLAWVLLRFRRPADLAPGTIALDDARIEMLHVVTNYRGLLYSTVVPEIAGPRSGSLTLHRAGVEAGAEVEGVLSGEVERAVDGRRIVLRELPIEALVKGMATKAVL